tara:strand:- start:289 stop:3180 length:2892 start_codon:yes stop_codon:yes gene_type:complete
MAQKRIEFKDQTRKPPEGPDLKNWNSMKLKPYSVLKAIKRTYKNTDYSFPKDYINSSHKTLCERKGGDPALSSQQKFVADFMRPENPTRGILVYHGLGSGKTITSIVVGEAMKYKTTKGEKIPGRGISKVLIVVPVPLIDQYKETIQGWGPRQVLIDGEPQNYRKTITGLEKNYNRKITQIQVQLSDLKRGDTDFIKLERDLKKIEKSREQLIKERHKIMDATYEIISHQKFINLLVKRNDMDGTYTRGDIYGKEFKNPLRRSGTLLIIDEIQRLVSEAGPTYKKLLYSLKFHSHKDMKTVILSATPIYDKPYEAALTMNLLKPRIPFPSSKDKFYEIFFKDKSRSEPINDELFKYLCSGYVSYYSGGNPRAFPFKTEVVMCHRMNSFQETRYKEILESEIKKALKDKVRFAELADFVTTTDNEDGAKEPMNVFMLSQMYCNVALPGVDEEMREYLKFTKRRREYDPLKPAPKIVNKDAMVKRGLDNFGEEIETAWEEGGMELAQKKLEKYSKKFSNILKMVERCEGPVFIFSNFLDYGVNAFARVLSAIGYEQFSGTFQKNLSDKPRFAVWSAATAGGKKGALFSKNVRNLFNSDDNKDGQKLKVILGTRSIMEGVSFMNTREVHIMDPWWNEARIDQIAARAIRNCSHKALPPSKRSVIVYKHFSAYNRTGDQEDMVRILKKLNAGGELLRSFEDSTIELYMYGKASEKMNMTQHFLNLMKQSAVDCGINKEGNLVRLVEMYLADPGKYDRYYLNYRNPSTGKEYYRSDVMNKKLTEDDVISGRYSYMNISNKDALNFKDLEKEKILGGLGKGLVLKERVKCNTSKLSLMENKSGEIVEHFYQLYRNNKLTEELSRLISTGAVRRNLYSFVNSTSNKKRVKDSDGNPIYKGSLTKLRNAVRNLVMKRSYNTPREKLVRDLIFKYEVYGVEDEEQLLLMPESFLKEHIETEKRRLALENALE